MTSALPSPSTSTAYMSAQGSLIRPGWNFHAVLPSALVGCSYQPPATMTSSRPSPLRSPTPRPWSKWNVPGQRVLPTAGPLIGCSSQVLVGSLPGVKYDRRFSLSFLPFTCQPMTSTRLPVLNRSTYCGVSLQAECQISCFFQCPALPLGFWYQWHGRPGKPMTMTSG